MQSQIHTIENLPIEGKRLFLRLDFNVPISEGKILDDTRMTEALPTLKHALSRQAKIIIATHLGRPEGKPNPEFSLEPVASRLAELLDLDVTLADNCMGEGIELMAQSLKGGQVLLLENLRFHAGEEKNDPKFVSALNRLTDVYVTDAFGTAHRKHASTYGLPALTPIKGMGYLIHKEVKSLERLLHHAEKPFYAILGGSKVTDKIKTIDSLLNRVQGLVIGGAMAHAFWAVQGDQIPAQAKQPKPEDIEAARSVLKKAKSKDIPIIVPADTQDGFDIGPKTLDRFQKFLSPAKTVFWNGPLGWFEKPPYEMGTYKMAEFVGHLSAFKVVGGGDTVSAIKQSGQALQFDHLSTGGGAVLEYLENEGLPGIDILTTRAKNDPSG